MGILRNNTESGAVYTLNGEEVFCAQIRMQESVKVIEIKGAVKTMVASCMAEILEEHLRDGANVILDFQEVTYIASAGLRVLLNMQQKIDEEETHDVKIINVAENVMDVLEATGFIDILHIER